MATDTTNIDHLSEDEPIPGQQWVCLSFLSPEGIKNCSIRGLKIRGVYSTKKEAKKRADYLQSVDNKFHVFIGEVGKWLPWDPEPDGVEDEIYAEKELNDLMCKYKENLEKSKKFQQDRKQDLINRAASQEQQNNALSRKEKARQRARRKLEQRRAQKKMKQPVGKDNDIEEKEKLVNEERKRLLDNENKMKEKESNISNIDDKLAKIQELYRKLEI